MWADIIESGINDPKYPSHALGVFANIPANFNPHSKMMQIANK
jgi:hypothetical protein